MKKSCLIILLVMILLPVLLVSIMFFAKICPPNGPWPMPPWCEKGTASTFNLPENLPQLSDLPMVAEDSVKEIELENAIVVPIDVSAISYPDFYNMPTISKVTVSDPYCAIVQEQVAYPAEYLGNYDFPAVNGAPLPVEITRSIGIKDVWISEPNLNDCNHTIPYAPMRESLDRTLERVKALGAEEITFSNYISFKSFSEPLLNTPTQAAISESDMRYFASHADEMGLGMTLYLNLAPGSVKVIYEIQGEEWLRSLHDQWELFVLDQAKIAEETGIDAMMINHFDYQPGVQGFETVYQEELLETLTKMREIYSGRILLLIEPVWGADLSQLDDLLQRVDGFIYTPITSILQNAEDKSVNVDNLRNLYERNLSGIADSFNKYNKPFLIRVLIQSEKDFLEKGWNEDMFCIARGEDPCYQKNLTVDFSLQAVAIEAMMEAIANSNKNGLITINNLDIYGYWYTDVILPDFSQPQMAHSIRNKPAESIVYQWYKR